MKDVCVLIKTSELNQLKKEVANCKKLTKETVEKKTVQLCNDISIKDKEIVELKATIAEMKLNPQIDPMKMEISIERLIYRRKAHNGSHEYSELYERTPIFDEKCLNFSFDEKLYTQIRRIGAILVNRDRQITEKEVENRAEVLMGKIRRDFEMAPKNDLIEKIMKMDWLERRVFFRQFREDKKNGWLN